MGQRLFAQIGSADGFISSPGHGCRECKSSGRPTNPQQYARRPRAALVRDQPANFCSHDLAVSHTGASLYHGPNFER
jgi:hypothetical protein